MSTVLASTTVSSCLGQVNSTDTPGIVREQPATGRYVAIDDGYMVPYRQEIPGTSHAILMEPIPGRAAESSSSPSDRIEPFWMARYETRHADYLPYMRLYRVFKEFEDQKIRVVTDDNRVDAVTAPTEIYDVYFAFEYGMDMQQPVATMTMLGARQYTKWLSKLSQIDFRLPTAGEWEHACRAGTTTAWHSGDAPALLQQYACFGDEQAVPGYQRVGLRKPNAWGLHDMHGNLAEWVLQPGITDPDQQIMMGGCWAFPANRCRSDSALKFESEPFREYDPNVPQSPWWLASDESRWVGFRIIRPLIPMDDSEKKFAWECHTDDECWTVRTQLEVGRGVLGIVDPALPSAINQLETDDGSR